MTDLTPLFDSDAGWRPDRAPAIAVPVTALVRDSDAGLRSVIATRDLVRLVAELDEDSAIALTSHSEPGSGSVRTWLEVYGTAAADLSVDDLRSVLGGAVLLGEAVPLEPELAPAFASAFELHRISMAPVFRDERDDDPPWSARLHSGNEPRNSVPTPNPSDSAELVLAALGLANRQVWVRTVLAPANELERRLVIEDLNATLRRTEVATHAGSIVRARTVATSTSAVPSAVRARLRHRSPELVARALDPGRVRRLWDQPVAAVRGHAVGELHAMSLARVPSAGVVEGTGMSTRRPEPPERRLDPVPPAAPLPIRLGWARDAIGEVVNADLDITDLGRHLFVEGRPGTGKTTVLRQLFRSLVQAGHSVVYLDPHGDGAAAAAAYSTELPGARTLYIRHGDQRHPVGINPLHDPDEQYRSQSVSGLLELMQDMIDPRHEGFFGERGKRTVSLAVDAARVIFGDRTSLHIVVALLLERDSVRALAHAIRSRAPDLARRLGRELVDLPADEYAQLVSWLASRFQPWLRTPALRAILGTGADPVDLVEVLDTGTNLIVDLASLTLGAEVSRVLGALWLLKLRAAMGRRRDPARKVILLIDEAHLYTFGALPDMLAEARKFGVGIVVATQSPDNLSPRMSRSVEANCASSITLRTGLNTAAAASDRLGGVSPLELTRLKDLTAMASLSRAGSPTAAFSLHVDHHDQILDAGWTSDRIESTSDAVAARSRATLWQPFANEVVPSDAEILAALHD